MKIIFRVFSFFHHFNQLILNNLSGKADKHITKSRTYNLPAIMKEFERSIFKELDYMEEVTNIQKITNNFKEDETVVIPQAFKDYCTSKVITIKKASDNSIVYQGNSLTLEAINKLFDKI